MSVVSSASKLASAGGAQGHRPICRSAQAVSGAGALGFQGPLPVPPQFPADRYTNDRERQRIGSLLGLVPENTGSLLDIGSRDGHITRMLADRAGEVTALDLNLPQIADLRIRCVAGNAAALPFPDKHFDVVFCAEVLEHIPEPALTAACKEIARVARRQVVIGVPYMQDIRVGRVTCMHCRGVSPPWGHVNSFDESRLLSLFSPLRLARRDDVAIGEPGTNAFSTWLLDRAGNPYGSYVQEEGCIHCGKQVGRAAARSPLQLVMTRVAILLQRAQTRLLYKPRPNWIHLQLVK